VSLPRSARNPSHLPPGTLLQASASCRCREILIFIPPSVRRGCLKSQAFWLLLINQRYLLSVMMILRWPGTLRSARAGRGAGSAAVRCVKYPVIAPVLTQRWFSSVPFPGTVGALEIPRPSLSLATKHCLRGAEGRDTSTGAHPVHISRRKCYQQTMRFILVPADHKFICLLMQLLPVHVCPN